MSDLNGSTSTCPQLRLLPILFYYDCVMISFSHCRRHIDGRLHNINNNSSKQASKPAS